MNAWLVDIYRNKNRLVLWLKTTTEDIRLEQEYNAVLYVEDTAAIRLLLAKEKIPFRPLIRQDCLYQTKQVLQLSLSPDLFERFIRWFEQHTQHRARLYDADVKPELQFLYARGLRPFCTVELATLRLIDLEPIIPLTSCTLDVLAAHPSYSEHSVLQSIIFDDVLLEGDERHILQEFARRFATRDPDVLIMEHGFVRLPYLAAKLAQYNIRCDFHRWDPTPLTYRGGRSFFRYGMVEYRDYAIRLNGRLLVDTASTFGNGSVDGLIELCQLSGARLQQIASRSPGAVFQMSLLRELHRDGLLIPYKELPVNDPMSMSVLLKADRAGHTMDPKTGFHRNVAEIDFMSMFPWLMYNRNISAEMFRSDRPPFEYAPGLPIRISVAKKGFVPRAIFPFLERRMYYKQHPSVLNKAKAEALKAVLVSSNGYLRFREFKLGMARTHMALCAYARETMMQAKQLAEEQGFEVVHGIVDALYLKRPGMTEEDVTAFCKELEMQSGIPVSFEGIFSWIVFLTSVSDPHRPVPARYYGVYNTGNVKARGIEVRQRSSPNVVRRFQEECLQVLAELQFKHEIISSAPLLGRVLRETLDKLHRLDARWLLCRVRVGKEEYKNDTVQKAVVEKLRKRGVTILPGQTVRFIATPNGPVLAEEYQHNPAHSHYRKLLLRSLYVLLQPFDFTLAQVRELAALEQQMTLRTWLAISR